MTLRYRLARRMHCAYGVGGRGWVGSTRKESVVSSDVVRRADGIDAGHVMICLSAILSKSRALTTFATWSQGEADSLTLETDGE